MTYKHLIIIGGIITSGFSNAQTIIQTGDIAFLGIQSGFQATPTPKDRFAFVLLKSVEANTEIMFNDNSILGIAPLSMCRNESLAKWKATTPVSAGTVIVITESDTTAITGKVSGSISLSQSGDQIFGLQANGADTLLLAGVSITDWEVNCVAACGGASNRITRADAGTHRDQHGHDGRGTGRRPRAAHREELSALCARRTLRRHDLSTRDRKLRRAGRRLSTRFQEASHARIDSE